MSTRQRGLLAPEQCYKNPVHRCLAVIPIGVLAVAAPARAGDSSWTGTATGDVAATDNTFGTDRAQAEGDLFTQVRPGVLYAYSSPRAIQDLAAQLEVLEYAIHSDNPSVTVMGSWQGFFLPGPRSDFSVSVDGGTGQLNAITARTSPDQTTVGVTPSGAKPIDIRDGNASESFSWMSTKESRLIEGGFAHYTWTDDPNIMATTSSAEVGASLGFERDFRKDSLSLEAGASLLRLEYLAPVGSMPPSRLDRQLNPRAMLTWRHDFDEHWSFDANAGAVYVNPIWHDPHHVADTTEAAGVFPVFGGILAYTQLWGRATVTAQRTVAPNLLIAQNTVDDSVLAQLAMPLPWLDDNVHLRNPKLVGLASLGAERTQLLDPVTSSLEGEFWAGRLDAGVSYTPRPGQTWGLRYELVLQHASTVANMIVPAAPSFYRNTVYFTFALQYPDHVVPHVPRRSDSVRADRQDLSPVGSEPVVPDPTEPGDGGDSR